MLPKRFRLITHPPKKPFPKGGRWVKSDALLVVVIPRTNDQGAMAPSRFSFQVSKKIDKRSTRRNRTRRLTSEAVRTLLPKVKPGYDVIVKAQTILWQEKLDDVLPEVERLFKKAGLIKAKPPPAK